MLKRALPARYWLKSKSPLPVRSAPGPRSCQLSNLVTIQSPAPITAPLASVWTKVPAPVAGLVWVSNVPGAGAICSVITSPLEAVPTDASPAPGNPSLSRTAWPIAVGEHRAGPTSTITNE